jgi:hypothetical protein
MRTTLLVLLLTLPGLCFAQGLGEAAKKEKARREQNKKEGRPVQVIKESDITPAPIATESDVTTAAGTSEGARTEEGRSSSSSSSSEVSDSNSEEDERVPDFIPPDLPYAERLDMFERMKRGYERQVAQIDEDIAKNEARLAQIESEIGATSALGGAGLPVAPQTGTGTATRQMTGQESASLVGEQQRLQAMNQQLRSRKEQLKVDLQAKGRVGGIPPGYLRF